MRGLPIIDKVVFTERFAMASEVKSADDSVEPFVHTPGPWAVELSGCGAFEVYVPKDEFLICERPSPATRFADECKANGKLIAAAPDLLEALRLLWTEVSESGNATANDFGWRAAREATLAALRKVV